MLHLQDPGLNAKTMLGLAGYQAEVDAAGDYPAQVAAGKELFPKYNRKSNPVFRVVRDQLAAMSPGARRCGYCEDSAAGEVEHIAPKNLYPEKTFAWENYLYACGPCNRGKGGRYPVIIPDGQFVDVSRRSGQAIRKPPSGYPALINPRMENPLDFFDLEITETFRFIPRLDLSRRDEQRAGCTIEILKLNRSVLVRARRNAYCTYRARLVEYRNGCDNNAPRPVLNRLAKAVQSIDHPTVWREMQRQRTVISELGNLFADVPEALDW